jgi:hypothetical protein
MSDIAKCASWRTSSYSADNGGNCVEVADLHPVIGVRDSKNRDGGVLRFDRASWVAFVADARAGRYDLR